MKYHITSACIEHLRSEDYENAHFDDLVWIPGRAIEVDFEAELEGDFNGRVDMNCNYGIGNNHIQAEMPLLIGTWAALRCTWFDEQGRAIFSAPVSWKTYSVEDGFTAGVTLWSYAEEDDDEDTY